jgi:hypothetical protein
MVSDLVFLFFLGVSADIEKKECWRAIIVMSYNRTPAEFAGLFVVRTRTNSIGYLVATTGDTAVAEFQP